MRVSAFLPLMALLACQQTVTDPAVQTDPPVSAVPEDIALQAEQVIARDVSENFPHENAATIAKCIRNNSTDAELLELSEGALHAITDNIRVIVDAVGARPATRTCIRDNGASLDE